MHLSVFNQEKRYDTGRPVNMCLDVVVAPYYRHWLSPMTTYNAGMCFCSFTTLLTSTETHSWQQLDQNQLCTSIFEKFSYYMFWRRHLSIRTLPIRMGMLLWGSISEQVIDVAWQKPTSSALHLEQCCEVRLATFLLQQMAPKRPIAVAYRIENADRLGFTRPLWWRDPGTCDTTNISKHT